MNMDILKIETIMELAACMCWAYMAGHSHANKHKGTCILSIVFSMITAIILFFKIVGWKDEKAILLEKSNCFFIFLGVFKNYKINWISKS